MGGLLGTLWNGITAIGDWIVVALSGLWGAVLLVLDALLAVVVGLIGVVGTVAVGVFSLVLTLLLAAIPAMPEADTSAASGVSALAAANTYVPIAEALALLPVVGTVLAGIGAYKLAKFIRGGG